MKLPELMLGEFHCKYEISKASFLFTEGPFSYFELP